MAISGDTTESYTKKDAKEGERYYLRASREFRADMDRRNKEHGLTKEIMTLANGERGFVWR